MIFKKKLQNEAPQVEIAAVLRSLEDWHRLAADHPRFAERQYIDQLAQGAISAGATEPLTNMVIPAGQMQFSDNLREGMVYSSINSRVRAVMLCIQWVLSDRNPFDAKIYAAEAVTSFALRMRGIFPKFIGSEYATSDAQRDDLYPILCENLQELSFRSDVFDVVTTNEVLEHVSDLDQALSEIHRVLQPGGWHVGTAPFAMGQQNSVVKAKLENGQVVHLMEPEYHGNPVDEGGSLVFEIPAWDIVSRAKQAGFTDAHVKYIASTKHACFSSDAGGIFVFCFQK